MLWCSHTSISMPLQKEHLPLGWKLEAWKSGNVFSTSDHNCDQNRPWGRTSMEMSPKHKITEETLLWEPIFLPCGIIKIQTNRLYHNPKLSRHLTELFCRYFLDGRFWSRWLTSSLRSIICCFLTVSFHVSCPLHNSEIHTLKRTVSSPPPATLDLGSQNTSNPSSSTTTTDPLSVVCGQFECIMHRLMLIEPVSCNKKKW